MKRTPDNAGGSMFPEIRDRGINGRIFRTMAFATALALIASLPFAHWRITTGLLLGGVLSLLNHHWLSSSTAAALSVVAHGARPRLKVGQYVLRYLVVATAIFIAYKIDIVSLTASLIGLSTFVVALCVEAFRELYFAIIHREEIS
jgi:hypothetical protein